MSDIKLFKLKKTSVEEIHGSSVALEKSLQALIEKHLEAFLGVRFLATEYSTGKTHRGRIDTLGIDENGYPVIIEYKRATNENVINQGLFYLDWLLDHKAEFQLLVLEQLGKKYADIEWSSPRLLCIAGDFTKYDEHAVQQMNRNIELIRYRRYDDALLLFELINATTATSSVRGKSKKPVGQQYTTVSELLAKSDKKLRDLFESVKSYLIALGDDVQIKTLKFYFAFKRIKNFACVEVHPQKGALLVYLKVCPKDIAIEEGFSRDVRNIGHFGTGDLELTIRNEKDFEKAKNLILQSYEMS